MEPTIAVDTHIFRVANRTGLAPRKDVLEVERKLLKHVPEEFRQNAHPLANPARALRVQGKETGLSGLRHPRPVEFKEKTTGQG